VEKKSIAILGAGLLQQPLIREARALGFKTIVLDKNSQAIAAADADEFFAIDIADAARVVACLAPFRERLQFVITIATDFSHIVAAVNDAFGLPGANRAQGRVLTHKGAMRDFCREHGHAHPPYIYTTKKDEAEAWARDNPCPAGFVIKPVQNMGARGVMYLKEASELAFAFEFAQAHGGARLGGATEGGSREIHDTAHEVILEHYIPAREISVDALCFEGKVFLTGVADRLIEIKDRHFFIENGHTLPGDFTPAELEGLRDTMQRYADSLGSLGLKPYHGALKGDLRLTENGAIVIGEIAGRLSGGFMSTHTYPAAHGKNLLQMFLRLMAHDASVVLDHADAVRTQGVAIERSLYAEPGEISGLLAREALDKLEAEFAPQGLKNIFCNYANGALIGNLQNNIGKVYHTVIHAADLASAEALFSHLKSRLAFQVSIPPYNARAMAKTNREKWNNKFCWVCKVCDGDYCASNVPGMGGPGLMNSFRDNYVALQEYKLAPVYAKDGAEKITPDITLRLFSSAGPLIAAPVLSAPITGSVTNMGGSITEFDYAFETGSAMKGLDLMPTFGDGAAADKYRIGLHATQMLGRGIPIFKPRAEQQELIRRIEEAERAGATAYGVDIDGVSFKTMVLKSAETRHKSLAELKELAAASHLPFVIKGVMSTRDAETAAAAGAAAIIVSNHGGRIADGMPGTARVLPQIARWVKTNAPQMQVFADGGVRSGADIFRMLALGAEGVLIGRPIAIAAVGHGRSGVQSMLNAWLEELKQIMRVMGLRSLREIRPEHVAKFL